MTYRHHYNYNFKPNTKSYFLIVMVKTLNEFKKKSFSDNRFMSMGNNSRIGTINYFFVVLIR